MMMASEDQEPEIYVPEPKPNSDFDSKNLTQHFSKNMTKPKITNIFKKVEKKYKLYQNKQTDFSDLIDFEKNIPDDCTKLNLTHPETNQPLVAYKFDSNPEGLIVIKNYFSLKQQIEIAHKALNEYIFDPFRTNLFIYEDYSPYPVKYREQLAQEQAQETLEGENEADTVNDYNPEAPPYNYKHFIHLGEDYNFNSKLRWANLGHQYNWTNRCYYPADHQNHQEELPPVLDKAAIDLVKLLDMGGYKPQSVIVNFYNRKSAMGGHLDDGEPDQEHPILSFSIGLEGVFLIGGRTRSEGPVREIGVRGGDVVIMSGESRRRVHGVPRIRETAWAERWSEEEVQEAIAQLQEEKPHIVDTTKVQNDYEQAFRWLGAHRLNLNFRQVVIGAENE